jgi:uncharacterized protein (DUF362 family)
VDFRINRRSFLKFISFLYLAFFCNSSTASSGNIAKNGIAKLNNDPTGSRKSRVLRIYGRDVIKNYQSSDLYLESINTEVLNSMVGEGIKAFTQEKDLDKAWRTILVNFGPDDRIAIKPNFNFLNHGYKYTITVPQLIGVVVRQLVENVGVKPQNIFIYDLCKKIPQDIVRNRIRYPVSYIERMDAKTIPDQINLRFHYGLASYDTNAEIEMREHIVDENNKPVKCYIPKIITQVQHIINMPLLTNHIFTANSGALKNHYGTVRFNNYHNYPGVLHGKVLNKSVVDINFNSHIRNKTRIIIADGLFGVFDRGDSNEGGGKKVWKTFKNDFPKSIFISKDPVAIDSVMASLTIQERKKRNLPILSTGYLSDAMSRGLGICEISENGTYKAIEYLTKTF